MKIQQIDKKIDKCSVCGKFPKPTCSHIKIGRSNILIIGESPAKNGWLLSGRAFYDINGELQATGKILQKLLNLCDLTIDDISFTECCKCHILDRTKLKECSFNCSGFLFEQLEYLDVDIILTMGVFATQVFLGKNFNKFSSVVGSEIEYILKDKSFKVVPIYHCSPVNPLSFKGNKDIFLRLRNMIKK